MSKVSVNKCKLAERHSRESNENYCDNCIRRLIYGSSLLANPLENWTASGKLDDSFPAICPLCCGLLQLDNLCFLIDKWEEIGEKSKDENVLACIVQQMYASKWKFTAYHLQVTEPINIAIREQMFWSQLLNSTQLSIDIVQCASEEDLESVAKGGNVFTSEDVECWKRTAVSVKVLWKWIVEPVLNSVLKVPIMYSFRGDPDSISNVICVHLEFVDPNAQFDCDWLIQRLKHSKLPIARSYLNRLVCAKHKRRNRFHPSQTKHDHSLPSVEVCSSDGNDKNDNQTSLVNQNGQHYFQVINLTYAPPKSTLFSRTILNELLIKLPPDMFNSTKLKCPNRSALLKSIELKRVAPLVIAGRYVKLSRQLSQTPWFINSKRKLDLSVEELITEPIKPQFGDNCQVKFVTAGREDVDVRCLGLGRPFILELDNYAFLSSDILQQWSLGGGGGGGENVETNNDIEPLNLLKLAHFVNTKTHNLVLIRDLQFVSSVSAASSLKLGEMEKSKCYRALCWCPQGGLNTDLIQNMTQYMTDKDLPVSKLAWPLTTSVRFGPIELTQITPIRVLHRRTLMNRIRTVYSIYFSSYDDIINDSATPEFADFKFWTKLYPTEELFFIDLRCQAGTYVKEFVHGDLGRCIPNLASIFKRQIDILALDVTAVELDWPKILSF